MRPHILGLVQLILVEDSVLGPGAVEPRRLLGFDQHATGAEDADLRLGGVGLAVKHVVIVVVGNPGPNILKVPRGLASDMKQHRGAITALLLTLLGARRKVKISAFTTANPDMGIPHARLKSH